NEAHERRMMSRSNFIESNPGAVSPQERAAALQWNRDQGLTARERALQEHERGMLGDKIKGEVDVAHEKRLGMENQGVGAANINAQAGITNTEREWAARQGITDTQAKNALELEKERQRGELAITAQKGKDALITEQERQAGALDLETQRGKSAAELQKEALASQERQVNTQAGSAERIAQVQAGKDPAAIKRESMMKAEYAKIAAANQSWSAEQINAELKRRFPDSQQNDAPKEGDVKTLQNGQKAVFKNGQWQLMP
ncbi:MAG: hypothetical protein IKO55_12045, partial [Kiritimatiellae bacterium]|nr:hypothetical protein [Kiritimatiellia bacterium]